MDRRFGHNPQLDGYHDDRRRSRFPPQSGPPRQPLGPPHHTPGFRNQLSPAYPETDRDFDVQPRPSSSERTTQPALELFPDKVAKVANMKDDRYEDGEVRRFGAGESYRPFNSGADRKRSPPPARARSPVRARSPPLRPAADRGRTPPVVSDSYVPGRSPRRRSRSVERYRQRERSRDRVPAVTWRRRDRSRSRGARSPPRRSPVRRSSPPPRRSPPRFSSPRRDERPRSPRRDFDARDSRRRSRSPIDRDRDTRPRSPPMRRSPPTRPRGGSYRPRSRSIDRREDRFRNSPYRRPSPPPRDSHNTSAVNSQPVSRRTSPRPSSIRARDDRSRPNSPVMSPRHATQSSGRDASMRDRDVPTRDAPPPRDRDVPMHDAPRQPAAEHSPRPRSPPRGPSALRNPPTGPSSRNFSSPMPSRGPPSGPSTSITSPPSGPRGYPNSRGNSYRGGGRGGWSSIPTHPRHSHASTSVPQSSPTTNPPSGPAATIPTGPRSSSVSSASPSLGQKPFNPPTGPSAPVPPRPTLAQNLLNGMTPIIPGGKMDHSLTPLSTGVTKDLEPHHRKLKEEEERQREDIKVKQERLRRNLRIWDGHERDRRAFELKSELSERSLNNLAGEGVGGAAF